MYVVYACAMTPFFFFAFFFAIGRLSCALLTPSGGNEVWLAVRMVFSPIKAVKLIR